MGDDGVTYTVKELIGRLDVKLDLVLGRIDGKAEHGDVEKLHERVTALEMERASARSALHTTRFIALTVAPVIAGLIAHFAR